MTADAMIEMLGVHKRFGDVHALAGVDLSVGRGELVGLLGPNGAGKTTAISVLSTLVMPDAGECRVGGVDVVADPVAVRGIIGLTGQFAALDDLLTTRENLMLFGRLLKLGRARARRRADELLEQFDLVDAANRRVEVLSGGMRRRLDLAVSMIARPAVLFLDEPTTGLDPRSRRALWDVVRDLGSAGTTILLTTQYLEEADQLADRIVVIDRGAVIADGRAGELKARVGGTVLEVVVPAEPDRRRAIEVLGGGVDVDGDTLAVAVASSTALLGVAAQLAANDVATAAVSIRRPTLDDAFFALTGHTAADPVPYDTDVAGDAR